MKVYIINQDPLEVTPEQGRILMMSIEDGAEMVFIGDEMIKSSAVMGIRNDAGETIPKLAWGQLPEGSYKNFYDDHREAPGKGYEKFKAMKDRLLSR